MTKQCQGQQSEEHVITVFAEGRELTSELEPLGLLAEAAAGLVVIVLAVVALAGISTHVLAAIAGIVIGGALMVQAFNSAAEHLRLMPIEATATRQRSEFGGEILVDCMCGLTGIVLGILALVGIGAMHLLPAALIVYGGGLLVGGAVSAQSPGSFAASGMEMLIGLTAIVLGILSVLMPESAVLVLVGFLAVGATLLLVSASFSTAVMQFLTTV